MKQPQQQQGYQNGYQGEQQQPKRGMLEKLGLSNKQPPNRFNNWLDGSSERRGKQLDRYDRYRGR